ncbi:Lrp/AsnC family transcriptional regulator [Nocardioides sp. GY 10113]|nr:Lrp/AsnC family transcriptional regulator [Nocardioides sp. GY 10113]TIC85974.1 Lrp/AsnC family transcriptional regulator [Nocardioides sp. GY 10113]
MDAIDERIVSLLELDGRLTHREIAEQVDLSRSAAATRIQRLIGEGHVAVRGVAHPAVLGRPSLAHVSIAVHGSAAAVARAAAEREDTAFVSLVAGRYAVVAEIRTAGQAEIEAALTDLRGLPGVGAIDTILYTEVLHDVAGPVGEVTADLDDTDRALLRVLQEDGRASYVRLGGEVGLSAAGARRRVVRLVEGQAVRIAAVRRHSGSDRRSAMGIGLRLAGDHPEVLADLAALTPVVFAARSVGRCDAVLTVNAATTGELAAVLDAARAHPGVRGAESWSHLEVVKETYASVRL